MLIKKYFIIIFLLFLFFIIIEYFSFVKLCKIFPIENPQFSLLSFCKQTNFEDDLKDRYTNMHDLHFKDFIPKSARIGGGESHHSIIILGCSMAYGMNLKDKQSISYKLSEKLNAPVYNRAYPGGGLAQALYMLDSNELKNSLNNSSPKYILYFYQPDHIRRIFTRTTPSDKEYPAIFYKEKNKKLVRKYSLLQYSYFYSFFQDWYYFDNNFYFINARKFKSLFNLYLSTIQDIINTQYSGSKFIIVLFAKQYDFENEIYTKYNIIDIPKLTGIDISDRKLKDKYWVDNNEHPNELYWDTVIPVIIEELKKF